jgi:phosphotriesterase-related protein
MATVRTLSGPLDVGELGRTLTHEHIVTGSGGMERYPGLFDAGQAVEWGVEALTQVKQDGIDTIIDVTTVDLGRQIAVMREVAEGAPVNVVACTGVYRWVPPPLWGFDADGLAELFLREIEDGIEGTDVRAGIIKIAWDEEAFVPSLRERFETVARAAARASKKSGLPVSCHTLATACLGEPLLDIFEEEGVPPGAVYIGHSNDTSDVDYLLRLAKRGAVIGMDRYFAGGVPPWRERSACVKALVDAGYGEQVCLSHDHAAYGLWGGPPTRDPATYSFVPTRVLPWLKESGLTDEQIEGLMVRAPRRMFEQAAAQLEKTS